MSSKSSSFRTRKILLNVTPRRARTETVSTVLRTGFNGYEVVGSEASGKGTMGQASIELKEVELGNSPPQWVRFIYMGEQ